VSGTASSASPRVAPGGSMFYWNNNFGYGGISGARAERGTKALLVQ
jgi:hypothetical protein